MFYQLSFTLTWWYHVIMKAKSTNDLGLLSKIIFTVGGIGMLVGALDPMEGALLILPASALVALGTFLSPTERRFFSYRVLVFVLIAIGVGAMWGLTSVGGFGGSSGRTMWWGTLMLPYLIGWSMGIWGPGSPRWLVLPGIAIGLFYLTIAPLSLTRGGGHHQAVGAIVIGTLGLMTILGCLIRLRQAQISKAHTASVASPPAI